MSMLSEMQLFSFNLQSSYPRWERRTIYVIHILTPLDWQNQPHRPPWLIKDGGCPNQGTKNDPYLVTELSLLLSKCVNNVSWNYRLSVSTLHLIHIWRRAGALIRDFFSSAKPYGEERCRAQRNFWIASAEPLASHVIFPACVPPLTCT